MKQYLHLFLSLLLCVSFCFAANPTITFNTGTGSDTQASGSGGTAVFGTGAVTGTTNLITVIADAPNLSGIATDGSAAVWVLSSSGRRSSKITAVDNTAKTILCQDNFTNVQSGVTWAVGGKRALLNVATMIGTDAYDGWTILLETDQTIGNSFTNAPGTASGQGMFTIKGDSATTRRIITCTNSGSTFLMTSNTAYKLENLQFKNSNVTKTLARAIFASTCTLKISNCIFGDSTNKIKSAVERNSGSPIVTLDRCEIKNCTANALGATSYLGIFGCYVHNNDLDGFLVDGTTTLVVADSIFSSNGGDGIRFSAVGGSVASFMNNTMHGNTGDGLDTSSGSVNSGRGVFVNNNFTANGGYGWRGIANADDTIGVYGYNNFGTGSTANTSGPMLNITSATTDLAVDPQYVNTALINFAVGGAVRNSGYPVKIADDLTATRTFKAIGVSQPNSDAFSGAVMSY